MKKLYSLTKAGSFIDFIDIGEIAVVQPDGLNKFTTIHFKSGLSVIYTSASVRTLLEAGVISVYETKEETDVEA